MQKALSGGQEKGRAEQNQYRLCLVQPRPVQQPVEHKAQQRPAPMPSRKISAKDNSILSPPLNEKS